MLRLLWRETFIALKERVAKLTLVDLLITAGMVHFVSLAEYSIAQSLVLLGLSALLGLQNFFTKKTLSEKERSEIEVLKTKVDALLVQKSVKQPFENRRMF